MAPTLRSPTKDSFSPASSSRDILQPNNSSHSVASVRAQQQQQQQGGLGKGGSNQYLTPLGSPIPPLSPASTNSSSRKKATFADMTQTAGLHSDDNGSLGKINTSVSTFAKPSRSKSMRQKFRPDRSEKEPKTPKVPSNKSPLIQAAPKLFRSAKKSASPLEGPSESSHQYLSAPELAPRPSTSTGSFTSSLEKKFFGKLRSGKHDHDKELKLSKSVTDKGREVWASFKKSALTPKSGGAHTPYMPVSPFRNQKKTTSSVGKSPVDIFTMGLMDAAIKTRVANELGVEYGPEAYWIPALAYRCIQFLDKFGPRELGIYRISGSLAVVDELKAEFVTCHDVDLLENPPIDIHTVSSLLKGWLRGLGERDPLLPDDVRKQIYEQCQFSTRDNAPAPNPPKAFSDALSNLPPYNYYLLKAFFTHLRRIDQASDENKMNLANLAMIFCSGLRIDRFMFNWLVLNCDECFRGCLTEVEEFERINNLNPRNQSPKFASDNISEYSLIVPPHSAPASRKPSDASTTEKMRKEEPVKAEERPQNLTVTTQPSKQSLHPNDNNHINNNNNGSKENITNNTTHNAPSSKPSSTHSRPSFTDEPRQHHSRPHTPQINTNTSNNAPAAPPPAIKKTSTEIVCPYPLTPTSTNGSEDDSAEIIDAYARGSMLDPAMVAQTNGRHLPAKLDTEIAQKLAPCLPELEPISPLM